MNQSSPVVAFIVAMSAVVVAAACSSSSKSSPHAVTFANTIEALVQDKCQSCHHDGGIAPFALVSYDQLKAVAGSAKDSLVQRDMPPWGAFDDPTCTVSRKFKDNLSLTPEQIGTFTQWIDRGMPLGDVRDRPPPRTVFAERDLVGRTHTFEVAEPYVVEAMGKDEIRCFPLDPGFDRDTWIGESIVVPVDAKVVHHALVYIDREHEGVAKAGSAGSYSCFGGPELKEPALLLAWSPGGVSTTYGENAGVKIAKNAHLVMQVHYHPIATAATGRMSIELKALPARPAHVAEFALIGNASSGSAASNPRLLPGPDDPPSGPAFLIPSNAKSHTESMEFVIPDTYRPSSVAAVGAHMHWAGVGMKIEVHRKRPIEGEPESECLFSMPKYDFNWQRTFAYDTPLSEAPVLRAGDSLRITCIFDNTTENRHIARVMSENRLATPPDIRLGAESLDEMCQAMLVVID